MRSQVVALTQIIVIIMYSYFWFNNTPRRYAWLHIFYPFALASIMFPVNYCVNSLFNIVYPSKWTFENSKYYMYSPPNRPDSGLVPDLTICIPIYKEDFYKVVIPTLTSAILARLSYHGKCNIVVLDDGYQFQDQEIQSVKKKYYQYHDIGMVARPREGRLGKFKKGSNLNNHLHYIWTRCASRNYGIISGNCQIGDYIILIDSDSRIPDEKINEIVYAIDNDPTIGYIQFHTIPLDNSYVNYFSRQIAQFTKNLYDLVFVIVTSSGEPAPLVGHNAIIRTKVLREVDQGRTWWSENKVSEDFDFAFRVIVNGYHGVYATFASFQEGISFDLHSELLKMSKFTYGSLEMLTSKTYLRYIAYPNTPWSAKINITSYMCNYIALGLAPILAMLQLILSCYIDNLYQITLDPVVLMVVSFIIFSILGPISTYIFLRRQGKTTYSFKDQCNMGMFMFLFYTGSMFWFLLGLIGNRSWGSTKKEQGKINVIETYRLHYIATTTYLIIAILVLGLICFNWYGAIPLLFIVALHYIIPRLWRGSTDKTSSVEILV